MPSTRRTVLSAVVAVLAGCAGARDGDGATDSTLSPAPVDTSEETPSATSSEYDTPDEHDTPEYYRSLEFLVNDREVEAVGEGVLRGDEHLRSFEADLVETAVAEGEATFTTYSFDPLRERVYVHRDGYYRIDRSVASTRRITVHRFSLDAVTTCGDPVPTDTEVIAYEDLSEPDRRAFVHGHEQHLDDDVCFGASYFYHYESDAAVESSVLVDGPRTFVRYRGDVYDVEFSRTHSAEEITYRFVATKLGESLAAYAETVAPEVAWLVDPDSLSAEEREFLDRLIENGYYREENPIPASVDAVANAVRRNAYAHGRSDEYYLRYEGTYYGAKISEAVS